LLLCSKLIFVSSAGWWQEIIELTSLRTSPFPSFPELVRLVSTSFDLSLLSPQPPSSKTYVSSKSRPQRKIPSRFRRAKVRCSLSEFSGTSGESSSPRPPSSFFPCLLEQQGHRVHRCGTKSSGSQFQVASGRKHTRYSM